MMRFLLGLLFVVTGVPKALHPELFASQIAAYQLVPSQLITLVALALPRIEILAGLGLCANFRTRSCALVTGALSLAFAVATTLALARGLAIDCGCLPVSLQLTWVHPIADLVLLALSVREFKAAVAK